MATRWTILFMLMLAPAPASLVAQAVDFMPAAAADPVVPPPRMEPRSWAYQLQNLSVAQVADNGTFDMIVMDHSQDGTGATAFTPQDIARIKAGGKRVIAYISIGEAEDYRDYWQDDWTTHPPAWLGPQNPDWPGNYKVRFWMPAWRSLVYQYIDGIIEQGFDGIYMDIIDAYEYWMDENPQRPDADSLMVRFVADIRDHVASSTAAPFFLIPQNGEELLASTNVTSAMRALYLGAIDAIGVEDVFFPGSLDEDNPFDPTASRLAALREYLAAGKQVFSIEYLTDPGKIAQYRTAAAAERFIPYACTRDLASLCDGMVTSADGASPPADAVRAVNYPNPFRDRTNIVLSPRPPEHPETPEPRVRSLLVFDLLGRTVLRLGPQEARITITRAQLPGPGVYPYRAVAANTTHTGVLLLLP